jgi:P4 family phage/plasmid primase-like protien
MPVSKKSILFDEITRLRQQGFALCGIMAGEKVPRYKGWTRKTLEIANFIEQPSANIGILAGALSGNLVVIDLDKPEIRTEAAKRLPQTMSDGRPSCGPAHYYYRVVDIPPWAMAGQGVAGGVGGPRIFHFADANGKPIGMDFLGTGSQVVCPPSLHHSGERRRWFDEPDRIVILPYLDVWAVVKQLAKDFGATNTERETISPAVDPTGIPCQPVCTDTKTIERAIAYIVKIPPAVSGMRGHDATMWAARAVVWGFNVGAELGFDLLQQNFNHRCDPPWSDAELLHKCEDADTTPFSKPRSWLIDNGLKPHESVDDPHRLARLYLAEQCEHPDGQILRSWRATWQLWNGTAYRELLDAELQVDLTTSVKRELDRHNLQAQKSREANKPIPTVQKVTRGMIGNVALALASETLLPGTVEQPSFFDGQQWEWRNLIAFQNGLLDVDLLFAGKSSTLLEHTPRWFSPYCLPYPYSPDASCPHWLAFLERNLEGDAERISLLQEWFGYSITSETSRQKFLLLEGEGSNGKSVVCAVLEAMLGTQNCSHVPLECFGGRFQLTATLGKLANIASEVGELDRAAEGFLKSFTSGDAMQFEQKHMPTFSAVPTARLVLATNNRPRFSDRSGGLWRRMILMPFRVVIAENDPARVYGMDKPDWWIESGELPGILNWALAGLDRLRRQDRFTTSSVCMEALSEYRTENNPARLFLAESTTESIGGNVPCAWLYQSYTRWCEANGYSPLADRAFGKEVVRVFPKAERKKVTRLGCRQWSYCGIDNAELMREEVIRRRYKGNGTVGHRADAV